MPTQVQTRRGTTAQHTTFTGAAGELTVDTDKKTVVVHDGTTAGGAPLLRENGSQNAVTTGTSTAASFIPTGSTVPTNGVFLPAANTVGISTNSTQRVTVTPTGAVLVGTSTARSNFYNSTLSAQNQIEGTDYSSSSMSLTCNSTNTTGAFAYINLCKSAGATVGSNTLTGSGHVLGQISFQGSDGTEFVSGAEIQAVVDGTSGANDLPTRLVFSTTADGASSPTERMRIRSDGNVGIGAPGSSNVRLNLTGADATSSNFGIYVSNASQFTFFVRNDGAISTGTAATSPYNLTTASAANCHIFSDGYLYRSTSSARYKTNIETIQDFYSDALLSCRPVWYQSIAPGDTQHPDWGYWGFIAEEVAKIDPRLVFWKTHETVQDEQGAISNVELEQPVAEGVQYDRFVPHLLNLIKRQQQAIEVLEAEVAALKAL